MAERLTFAVGADAARIRSAIDLAKTARAAAGLNPDDLSFDAYVNVACDDDIKRARAIIKGSVGTFAHFTGMSAANSEGLPDAAIYRHIGANYDMANHARGAAGHMQSVPDEFVSRFAVTGNASYCVNRLGELIALGLDRLVLLTGSGDSHSDHTAASMERLASDVLPQLR